MRKNNHIMLLFTAFFISFGLIQVGECCLRLMPTRDDAGGFLTRSHIEEDLRNIPSSWKYENGQYPPGLKVRLKYLQRGENCDPTTASMREFSRLLTVNFTHYKDNGVNICDMSKYMECDQDSRLCECMKVYTGYLVDKEGPYYLRWDEKRLECRATEGSYCDRKFRCGGDYTCKRLRCVCNKEDINNCTDFRRKAVYAPKFRKRSNKNAATTFDGSDLMGLTCLFMLVCFIHLRKLLEPCSIDHKSGKTL